MTAFDKYRHVFRCYTSAVDDILLSLDNGVFELVMKHAQGVIARENGELALI